MILPPLRQRAALLAALLLGMLIAPVAWPLILTTDRPAYAQSDTPLSMILVASAATVRPGSMLSLSVSVRTTSLGLRPVTAQIVLTGAATFKEVATPAGTCAVGGASATCQVSMSSDAPAAITAQVLVAASASGTLTADATAQSGSDSASGETARIQIQGDPLPSQGATATATASAPSIAATSATALATLSVTPTSTSPKATATPQATATPSPPGDGPDTCEPNDTLVQPCAVPSETDIGDLTFVEGSTDVFSLLLKGGRTYTLRAASDQGIDPVLTVYLAGAIQTPLATNDDAIIGDTAAVVQLMTATDAWYIVQIDNKAPGDMRGKIYTFSARSSPLRSGIDGVATASPSAPSLGDALENNYSIETAPRLGWGVPYDLSLVCPQLHACVAGDHDFFWVPVKAGIPIVAVTYDLGPGADTVATFYRPDHTQQDAQVGPPGWRPVVGNDDIAPGWSLRSQIELRPDWSGYTLLVVAPSERSDPPALPEAAGPAGHYRLIVGSPELAAVQSVLRLQTDGPPMTPSMPPSMPPTSQAVAPVVVSSPVTDIREVVKEQSATGEALVVANDTPFYRAVPPSENDLLARYPEGAQVRLLGQTYAGYVKVQPSDSVAPGWMYAPALRPLLAMPTLGESTPISGNDSGIGDGSASPEPAGGDLNQASGPTAVAVATVSLDTLEPVPLPTVPLVGPTARSLAVEVCTASATNLRSCITPIAHSMVEILISSTQEVIATARTDRDGQVMLSVSVPPGTQLQIRMAALGLNMAIDATATSIPIRMPPQPTERGAS